MSTADDLKIEETGKELSCDITETWGLWLTDAITVFARGCLAGIFPGVAGGVGGVAVTTTTDPETMVRNGLIGFTFGILVKGLERFHRWQDANEMPNPFRK